MCVVARLIIVKITLARCQTPEWQPHDSIFKVILNYGPSTRALVFRSVYFHCLSS